MAEIIPFRGILYNSERVSGDDVIAPPYDIITPEMKESLYDRSPYNVVKIDFGKELEGDDGDRNKYTRAAGYLDEWQKEGILTRSRTPEFYAYRMDYTIKGRDKSLKGFFALVRLEELGKGSIYPHEATYSKPKLDRLTLLKVSGANTSPIFSIYNSPGSTALAGTLDGSPCFQAKDTDGTLHSLWPLKDPQAVKAIRDELSDKAVIIADGHHRYETALDYRKAMREKAPAGSVEPYDYVLMFLTNMADEELTILPTHRVVEPVLEGGTLEKLSDYFNVETLSPDADIIETIKGLEHAFGLYSGGRQYVLRYKGGDLGDINPALRKLDVIILHKMIFERLLGVTDFGYEMDEALAREKVDRGDYGSAFFLNPTKANEVEEVALSMLRMPPKSTYFYPKVPTGLVINSLKSF
jgi:uncharacterized protein (DUF1015 family)